MILDSIKLIIKDNNLNLIMKKKIILIAIKNEKPLKNDSFLNKMKNDINKVENEEQLTKFYENINKIINLRKKNNEIINNHNIDVNMKIKLIKENIVYLNENIQNENNKYDYINIFTKKIPIFYSKNLLFTNKNTKPISNIYIFLFLNILKNNKTDNEELKKLKSFLLQEDKLNIFILNLLELTEQEIKEEIKEEMAVEAKEEIKDKTENLLSYSYMELLKIISIIKENNEILNDLSNFFYSTIQNNEKIIINNLEENSQKLLVYFVNKISKDHNFPLKSKFFELKELLKQEKEKELNSELKTIENNNKFKNISESILENVKEIFKIKNEIEIKKLENCIIEKIKKLEEQQSKFYNIKKEIEYFQELECKNEVKTKYWRKIIHLKFFNFINQRIVRIIRFWYNPILTLENDKNQIEKVIDNLKIEKEKIIKKYSFLIIDSIDSNLESKENLYKDQAKKEIQKAEFFSCKKILTIYEFYQSKIKQYNYSSLKFKIEDQKKEIDNSSETNNDNWKLISQEEQPELKPHRNTLTNG